MKEMVCGLTASGLQWQSAGTGSALGRILLAKSRRARSWFLSLLPGRLREAGQSLANNGHSRPFGGHGPKCPSVPPQVPLPQGFIAPHAVRSRLPTCRLWGTSHMPITTHTHFSVDRCPDKAPGNASKSPDEKNVWGPVLWHRT